MKTRKGYLTTALLALTLSGAAVAHDFGHIGAYPDGTWSGSATVWGHAAGLSGWSGSLIFGAVPGYPARYVQIAPIPPGHRHLASCRHAPPRYHAHAKTRHYTHGRSHGMRRFERHPGHH